MPPPAHADSELSAIVLKASAFQPEDRYQSAEEMRTAIAGYRNGTKVAIGHQKAYDRKSR